MEVMPAMHGGLPVECVDGGGTGVEWSAVDGSETTWGCSRQALWRFGH